MLEMGFLGLGGGGMISPRRSVAAWPGGLRMLPGTSLLTLRSWWRRGRAFCQTVGRQATKLERQRVRYKPRCCRRRSSLNIHNKAHSRRTMSRFKAHPPFTPLVVVAQAAAMTLGSPISLGSRYKRRGPWLRRAIAACLASSDADPSRTAWFYHHRIPASAQSSRKVERRQNRPSDRWRRYDRTRTSAGPASLHEPAGLAQPPRLKPRWLPRRTRRAP